MQNDFSMLNDFTEVFLSVDHSFYSSTILSGLSLNLKSEQLSERNFIAELLHLEKAAEDCERARTNTYTKLIKRMVVEV